MRKLFLILMTVMACTWTLSAQTRTFHGSVLDAANNEPLIGATIMPIGGGQGAAADIDGKFTLTVPAKVTKATVSYVGYKTVTVSLSDNMTVKLESTAASLDDLVVVAYGTANKESLTGSVAVVGSKDIEDRPVTSVTAALEGNAPGVQVNNTVGSPGSTPDIRIRGFNSINGSNAPLYVVDGIIFDGTIADLNPQDIESMSVLKDAASAALYGNRAANGVILITTKKAKNKGKVDVTLSIRQGWYNRGISEYDRLNPAQWMQTAFDANVNGLVSNKDAGYTLQQAIEEQRKSFTTSYAGTNIFGGNSEELFDESGKFLPKSPLKYYNDLDWWDAIKQTGYRQEYNVNAAAASDKFNIFASVGYLKEQGYIIATDFERFNARINANFNPTSYLRFGVNLHATQQYSSSTQIDADNLNLVTNPFLVMFNAPVHPYYSHDENGIIRRGADGKKIWNTASYLEANNIAWSLREDKAKNDALVVDGTIYGTAVIPYGFELTVKGSMHRDKTHFKSYSSDKIGSAVDVGALSTSFQNLASHTFMQTLNWSHDYGIHHVDVLLDHENWASTSESSSVYKNYQMFPNVHFLSNFEQTQSANGYWSEVKSESYLGRARYNYDQKYFAEFSIRRDGTSKFAKNNRWGTFWSVGASWVISKEKFMQTLPWVDYLKLRAAYGSVGNNASASNYAYWSIYTFSSNPYQDQGCILPAQFAAEDVKWEATKTFDIALEGTLFNDRLNFSIGYFNKQNSDLLFWQSQAASVGMTLTNGKYGSLARVLKNIGDMINWGWELSFSGDVIRTKDWRWGLSLDMTFYKNKITKLPDHHSIVGSPICRTEGKSMYDFYMYDWAGVDRLTGQSLYRISTNTLDFIKYDSNNKEVFDHAAYEDNIKKAQDAGALIEINGQYYTTDINYATRKFCGTALPTVYGSFGTSLSWKGINLSALFTYSIGGKVNDGNYSSLMNIGTKASAIHKDVLKSWTHAPEGMTEDSPNRIDPNGIPQVNTLNNRNNNAGSSRFLTDASYLVFKNLNISYDFPKKWVNPLKLQNLNLGFSVDNLFTATKRKGMNPQYSWSGGQGAYFVTARVFTFQLTAKF